MRIITTLAILFSSVSLIDSSSLLLHEDTNVDAPLDNTVANYNNNINSNQRFLLEDGSGRIGLKDTGFAWPNPTDQQVKIDFRAGCTCSPCPCAVGTCLLFHGFDNNKPPSNDFFQVGQTGSTLTGSTVTVIWNDLLPSTRYEIWCQPGSNGIVYPQMGSGFSFTTAPILLDNVARESSTSSSITVQATGTLPGGTFVCAAIPHQSWTGQRPSSSAIITSQLQGECQAPTSLSTCDVVIGGLSPSTEYNIFCSPITPTTTDSNSTTSTVEAVDDRLVKPFFTSDMFSVTTQGVTPSPSKSSTASPMAEPSMSAHPSLLSSTSPTMVPTTNSTALRTPTPAPSSDPSSTPSSSPTTTSPPSDETEEEVLVLVDEEASQAIFSNAVTKSTCMIPFLLVSTMMTRAFVAS